jgi:hypothetical protein
MRRVGASGEEREHHQVGPNAHSPAHRRCGPEHLHLLTCSRSTERRASRPLQTTAPGKKARGAVSATPVQPLKCMRPSRPHAGLVSTRPHARRRRHFASTTCCMPRHARWLGTVRHLAATKQTGTCGFTACRKAIRGRAPSVDDMTTESPTYQVGGGPRRQQLARESIGNNLRESRSCHSRSWRAAWPCRETQDGSSRAPAATDTSAALLRAQAPQPSLPERSTSRPPHPAAAPPRSHAGSLRPWVCVEGGPATQPRAAPAVAREPAPPSCVAC